MSAKTVKGKMSWEQLFEDKAFRSELSSNILPPYMMNTRWYAAKTQKAKTVRIEQYMPLKLANGDTTYLITLEINFVAGFTEYYLMTLAFVDESIEIEEKGKIQRTEVGGKRGWIIDALYLEAFRKAL